MPESQVDTETFNMFNGLSREEKMGWRREMIEYFKAVARVDRIDKRMEGRLGDRR